jgi:hypothetical protein
MNNKTDNIFDLSSKEVAYINKFASKEPFKFYGSSKASHNDLFLKLIHNKFMDDKQYIIGFTGTQHGMTDLQKEVVYKIIKQIHPVEVHCGDCIGADAEFIDIATKINTSVRTIGHIPLKESKRAFIEYTKKAEPKEYLDRNHDIVDQSQIMLATPNEDGEILRSGTWATIRYTRKQKKPLIIIYPSGNFEIENNLC